MPTSSSSARQCGENFWDRPASARTADRAGCTLYRVVGVMPADVFANIAFWLPFFADRQRRRHDVRGVTSRLRDGASLEAAAAEVNVLGHQLRGIAQEPDGPARFDVVRVGSGNRARQTGPAHLVRGCGRRADRRVCQRRQSVACPRPHAVVRSKSGALGASRGRIVAKLTESIVLSVVGGLAGTVIATAGVQVVKPLAVYGLPGVSVRSGPQSSIAACCRALTK